jgi:hypothetical protein
VVAVMVAVAVAVSETMVVAAAARASDSMGLGGQKVGEREKVGGLSPNPDAPASQSARGEIPPALGPSCTAAARGPPVGDNGGRGGAPAP